MGTALQRLNSSGLASLPAAVARPRYDRTALQPGIVHLGIGAFMRAHLAVATEAALHADGDLRWRIVGVSLRSPETRDALAPQDGLYTLAMRDADSAGLARQRLQVIGCIRQLLVAPDDPRAVVAAIAAPLTRIVSLTITEKGYVDLPGSAADFIVQGLAQRLARGDAPLTLMSLDNLASNGATLQRLVVQLAQRRDPALAQWIETQCRFPNSMVDRIVPRTTDADRGTVSEQLGCVDAWPVIAEPYFEWVVEDRFAAGRPAWEAAGVRFVESAAPWEQLKLRMVNGSHSAIAYLGAMAGWRTVDVAMAQPALRRYIETMMRDEIAPSLPPLAGLEPDTWRNALLARFANPALAHRTQQIAMDGSQKIPLRLLGTVRERLTAGLPIPHLALALAAWLHYLRGEDERERTYAIDDPLADELTAHVQRAQSLPDPRVRADVLTQFVPVFGDLSGATALVDAIAPALESLRTLGVRATLEKLA
jgi:fructuronate reductase